MPSLFSQPQVWHVDGTPKVGLALRPTFFLLSAVRTSLLHLIELS